MSLISSNDGFFEPPPPPDSVLETSMMSEEDDQIQPFGWAKVPVMDEGRVPCQRSLHACAVWNGSFYVFGGYDGHSRVNDMYEYNFALKRWKNIAMPMMTPSPRDRHAAVVYNNR